MIDPSTIILTSAIGNLLSFSLFIYFVLSQKNVQPILKTYTLGRLLQTVGFGLVLFYPDFTSPMYNSISIALFFPGIAFETHSLVRVVKPNSKSHLYQFLVISLIFSFAYAIYSEDIIRRVIVSASCYSFFFIYMFYELTISKKGSSLQTLLGLLMLSVGLANLFRGVYSFLSNKEVLIVDQGLIQFFWLITMLILAFVTPLLFILLVLEQDNLKLKTLNTSKNNFFKIIGSDLKSPMSKMAHLSEEIESNLHQLDEKKIAQLFSSMRKSSEWADTFLENLLDWAKAQTETQQVNTTTFSVVELINENIKNLQNNFNKKNITVHFSDVTFGSIGADRKIITTVVRNLLTNAIKFSHENGEIHIKTNVEKGQFEFSIKDCGIGLSKEEYSQLFVQKWAKNNSGTNNEYGTGLGLFLCSQLIKKHQGSIWVEGEKNVGSTFYFSIPSRLKN